MKQEMIDEIADWILRDAGAWGEEYEDTAGKRVFTFGTEWLTEVYEISECEITKNASAIMEACKRSGFWDYNWTESISYDWRKGFTVVMEGE